MACAAVVLPPPPVSRYRPRQHLPCSFRGSALRRHLPVSPHQSSHLCPFFISESSRSRYRPFLPDRPLFDCGKQSELLVSATDSGSTAYSAKGLKFQEWDSLTAKFAGVANVPFLLLQLPQIILNSRNLLSGNTTALFAVPWLGMLTGLLGNLSLLSYFAKKRETEAVIVQTLGVLSTYVVIVQLAMAEAMPLPQFAVTSAVVASGLLINFLNYFGWLHQGVWTLWEDFITVGGLSVLPQVMWSTFVPFIPNSTSPGIISCAVAFVAVVLARAGKLSEKGTKFVRSTSGWTATLLFMWMPVAQMWTNYLNPENIRGLSAFSMLLAMLGNGLLVPRALFIRDLMWFTGSSWGSFLHGWGNLLCMFIFNSIGRTFFLAATFGYFAWLGMTLWRDSVAYGYSSPMKSLMELISGPESSSDL
ncbi:maltose excess protein 1-like, chloroplastic [Dendrobium catenatum]|uniref:Maltose excess protein 1-like, chloroplastic n=1 Tax=Dendrobium catenatum TaxID=906689 RepID=A0A2I0XD70_9ASPA|nr:maltose excess protein 1-like, chloroplastic [Dendrobium catenatum]PKU85861.1 Maltose excess protein 1-like, chloroplastic [Dendrobium catenatum]